MLQKPVGFLQLIPKENVCLAQLKTRQIVFFHYGHAEDIGGCKDPASPRSTLICDWSAFEGNLDIEHLLIGLESTGLINDIIELVFVESNKG